MDRQAVYVVCAEGEEALAEQLAQPLREAGYDVTHGGTVMVGESLMGSAMKAVSSGSPIVLCATAKAVGSSWSHQIVNAGHSSGGTRVFVVQMEKQAYVDQLAVKAKVARFHDDPAAGVRDLLAALAKHFPPLPVPAIEWQGRRHAGSQYLDQPTEAVTFDVEALHRFRGQLREEVEAHYPQALSPWEFLERAAVWAEGRLTGTGALLFGKSPTSAFSAAMVKCVRYYGLDRSAQRDIETFDGTVPDQIVAAREFVARHIRRGEHPSDEGAQSVPVYGYPMIAIREIIANAVVHRDYSTADSCVHIRVFEDRLEISSPGTWLGHDLPAGVSQELTALHGQSIKRNFRLAHILSWVRLVEGEGSGIPSALRDCLLRRSPTPTVREDQGFITVTLRPCHPDDQTNGASALAEHIRPASLPPDLADFVGREAELARLTDRLDERGGGTVVISAITGMAGIGKTSLAVRFAHQVANRFPDGQLYVNLHGFDPIKPPMLATDVLAQVLTALDIPPHAVPTELVDRVALYRSLLANRRMLLLLDNAVSAEQVMPVLPGSGGSLVLITSRTRLSGVTVRTGASSLSLDVLSHAEAQALLARRLGNDRVTNEADAVQALIDLCDALPLALAIVAGRAAAHPTFPLSALVEELRDHHYRLDALDVGDGRSLRIILSWTYDALSVESARLFRLIGLHPGPDVGLAAVAALVDLPEHRTRTILAELSGAHLIEEHLPGRYRLHDLVRAYANEQSDSDDSEAVRQVTVGRVLDHYVHQSLSAAWRIRPGQFTDAAENRVEFRTLAQAVGWFTTECPVLLTLLHQIPTGGFDRQVWELARAIAPFLDLQGRWSDLSVAQELALAAAERLGDLMAQADSHRNLGVVHSQLGHLAEGLDHYLRALDLYQRVGDRHGEARTDLALSKLYELRNQTAEAADFAWRALDLFSKIADRQGEASALVALATCEAEVGHFDEAVGHISSARVIFLEMGDFIGESETQEGLGYIYHRLGHYDDALEHYSEALRLSRTLGNRYGEAVALNRLGDTLRTVGDAREARMAWQSALDLFAEFHDPDADTLKAKLTALDALDSPTSESEILGIPTILAVDMSGFGARLAAHQVVMREVLSQIVSTAFRRARIDWEACRVENRGDGMLILAPADVSKALFVDLLPQELARAVNDFNDLRPADEKLRLRVAVHAGEASSDEFGMVGASLNFACRLVDAAPLRDTLARSDEVLAFIVSGWFYDNVVLPRVDAHPARYRELNVAIKETTARAWVRPLIPG